MAYTSAMRIAITAGVLAFFSAIPAIAQQGVGSEAQATVFRTTVRRVIVDVVVTDKAGKTVPGLTRQEFSVSEDSKQQEVLSFDALGFSSGMDYVPPAALPRTPPNTFVNLPAQPEKGPLYVLLYDLVNIAGMSDQSLARQELLKFIEDKPQGTRFAIFVHSDGLHMAQGFTSDKNLLLAAIDPNHSRAHVPKIFLMGPNFGQGDPAESVWVLDKLASFLDGIPGRKNVIWFSGGFPLALFPSDKDHLQYYEEVKQMVALLARNQIAIYPVDARGLPFDNPHAPPGSAGDGALTSDSREHHPTSAQSGAGGGQGYSLLSADYMAEDEIARMTGGHAFYSSNDLAGALQHATEDGSSYYSLFYSPTNRDYDGKLRRISVQLARKGYTLSYRRAYYALDPDLSQTLSAARAKLPPALQQPEAQQRKEGDTLSAYMEHGAPIAHSLIFGAHISLVGAPSLGTVAQMADLAQQTALLRPQPKKAALKPLAPIKLQQYSIDYTVMTHQFQKQGGASAINLELAAAAYDADGKILNATVNEARRNDAVQGQEQPRSYRMQQVLFVPLNANVIRVAVHDMDSDHIGAMEVALPLQPEPREQSASRMPQTY